MAIGLAALTANAGPGVFNHLGFGAGIGTSGITIEAATPITNFVNLRAGVSWMPAITFNADADFTYTVMSETQTGTVNLKGDLGRVQGQVIFNVYPVPKSLYTLPQALISEATNCSRSPDTAPTLPIQTRRQ